jgi:hypothetical protein
VIILICSSPIVDLLFWEVSSFNRLLLPIDEIFLVSEGVLVFDRVLLVLHFSDFVNDGVVFGSVWKNAGKCFCGNFVCDTKLA